MKIFKYSAALFVIILFVSALTGCHAMYCIGIKADKNFMDGKMLDILIPMNENDENYLDSKTYFDFAFKGKSLEYVRNTEIYRYHENGYASMICHYPLTDYRISETDNLTFSEVCLNGKQEFLDLCDKYEKFKIAVLDTDGNILSVTEEYNFKSWKKCYIKTPFEYDCEKNTISPEYEYERDFGIVFIEFALALLMRIFSAIAIIQFFVIIVLRHSESELPKYYHVIFSFTYCLPSVFRLALRLDYVIHTVAEKSEILGKFLDTGDTSPFEVLYCAAPYILFVAVSIWFAVRKIYEKNQTN